MKYPAIVYRLDDERVQHADNAVYNRIERYAVSIITAEPDEEIRSKVAALPMCSFDRYYPADNLNHYVYNLYF